MLGLFTDCFVDGGIFFFSHEHSLLVSSPSLLRSSSFSWSRLRVPSDANVVERSRQAATIAFEVYIRYSEHSGHSMCMSSQRFIVDVVRSSHSAKQWFIIQRSQCSCRTSVCIEKTPKGSILSHHLLHLLHMMPTAKGYLLPYEWICMNGVIRFDSCGQADPLLWIFVGLGQQEACLKISRPWRTPKSFPTQHLNCMSQEHTHTHKRHVYNCIHI